MHPGSCNGELRAVNKSSIRELFYVQSSVLENSNNTIHYNRHRLYTSIHIVWRNCGSKQFVGNFQGFTWTVGGTV